MDTRISFDEIPAVLSDQRPNGPSDPVEECELPRPAADLVVSASGFALS